MFYVNKKHHEWGGNSNSEVNILWGNYYEKIYYIQKEEIQLGETTVFTPTFYENYDIAKADFKGLIKIEKDEIEGGDFVYIKKAYLLQW